MANVNNADVPIPVVGPIISEKMVTATDKKYLEVTDDLAMHIPDLEPGHPIHLTFILHGNVRYPVVAAKRKTGRVFIYKKGWKALLDAEGWELGDEIAFSASPNPFWFHVTLV